MFLVEDGLKGYVLGVMYRKGMELGNGLKEDNNSYGVMIWIIKMLCYY